MKKSDVKVTTGIMSMLPAAIVSNLARMRSGNHQELDAAIRALEEATQYGRKAITVLEAEAVIRRARQPRIGIFHASSSFVEGGKKPRQRTSKP